MKGMIFLWGSTEKTFKSMNKRKAKLYFLYFYRRTKSNKYSKNRGAFPTAFEWTPTDRLYNYIDKFYVYIILVL